MAVKQKMISRYRHWFIFSALLCFGAGVLFLSLLRDPAVPVPGAVSPLAFGPTNSIDALALVEPEENDEVPEFSEVEPEEWPEGVVPGELVFQFASNSQLENFLSEARRAGLIHAEAEPLLRLIRLRHLSPEAARLARSLAGDARSSYNPYVLSPEVPPLEEEGHSGRYRPFGDQALDWLGVPADNADWGRGVKVAVLDTGVAGHASLEHLNLKAMSLLDAAGQERGPGIHGTAVASLLAGSGESVRGVAPGVELMSIQVLDADGVGDGFALASGIMTAVQEGAKIINLSLGTPIHSSFLEDAVNYALARDVAVVASAGNAGEGKLLFPARYPGVVAVGAVDLAGQHVSFSNRGAELTISAPGLGLTAAAAGDSTFAFSGTSGSTPLVSGAIAALMSLEPALPPQEAAQVLVAFSNDAGPPDHDGYYGKGMMSIARATARNIRGVYDIAVADHTLDRSTGFAGIIVSIQNRGTEVLSNVLLEVSINGGREVRSFGRLTVGEVASAWVSLPPAQHSQEEVAIVSRVAITGRVDDRPWNDSLLSRIRLGP